MKKEDIFPIGIGTFQLDLQNQKETNKGLLHSCELWQNYFDISSKYEDWKVIKFLGNFIQQLDRNNIFINCKISEEINSTEDIHHIINKNLESLQTNYLDCIEFHAPKYSKIPLVESYKKLDLIKKSWKVKNIWISNASLPQLEEIQTEVSLDFFDWVFNLECKINENIYISDFCKKNNITFVCYQPLRRNRTAKRNYPLLVELANKYKKTQNQIVLNRLIKEKNIIPIVKTTNKLRIKENIESLDFLLKQEDYNKMNNFRSTEFDQIEIDWEWKGGITIDQLPNQFE